jgi:hypothetical protein
VLAAEDADLLTSRLAKPDGVLKATEGSVLTRRLQGAVLT